MAGLAAVGDVAVVEAVAESTGTIPAWGEDKQEGLGAPPPMLFCRGDRGLCAEEEVEKISQRVFPNETEIYRFIT